MPELFDYGIQNEDSHIRAHVCPRVRRIYVYPTAQGIEALNKGRDALGYQPGVTGATANGKLVKPFDIAKCVSLQINDRVWDAFSFDAEETTIIKGEKAKENAWAPFSSAPGVWPAREMTRSWLRWCGP